MVQEEMGRLVKQLAGIMKIIFLACIFVGCLLATIESKFDSRMVISRIIIDAISLHDFVSKLLSYLYVDLRFSSKV